MIYLSPPSTDEVRAAMLERPDLLGQLYAHPSGNRLNPAPTLWALDNGVVRLIDGRPQTDPNWDAGRWWAHAERLAEHAHRALFAVAPDVVGDAHATLKRSGPWLDRLRGLGYPVAFATQNGATPALVPWDAIDVLFTGGDDDWKLGAPARDLVAEALDRGLTAHMGRVNTRQRLRVATRDGYASCDGTTIARGPDRNLGPMLRWLEQVNTQTALPLPH